MSQIDTSKLGSKPTPAWAFNVHRAMSYGGSPVFRVWIARHVCWEQDKKPKADKHGYIGGGSRMDRGPYFDSRDDAINACVAAFDEWCSKTRESIMRLREEIDG